MELFFVWTLSNLFKGTIAVKVIIAWLGVLAFATILRNFTFLRNWILLVHFQSVRIMARYSRTFTCFLRWQKWALEWWFSTWVCGYSFLWLRFLVRQWRFFNTCRGAARLSFSRAATTHNFFKALGIQRVIFNRRILSSLVWKRIKMVVPFLFVFRLVYPSIEVSKFQILSLKWRRGVFAI